MVDQRGKTNRRPTQKRPRIRNGHPQRDRPLEIQDPTRTRKNSKQPTKTTHRHRGKRTNQQDTPHDHQIRLRQDNLAMQTQRSRPRISQHHSNILQPSRLLRLRHPRHARNIRRRTKIHVHRKQTLPQTPRLPTTRIKTPRPTSTHNRKSTIQEKPRLASQKEKLDIYRPDL